MAKVPAKGEVVNVNVSPEGKQRLQIGISWDAQQKEIQTGFLKNKTEIVFETSDLDLSCYIFDDQKKFLEIVSPENSYMMDRSEQINHSGDNTEGHMPGDDEFVSVNMATLPDYIHKMVFVVTSPDKKPFKDVANVVARVADGKTDEVQLSYDLTKGDNEGKIIFVFAGLNRDENQKSGWALQNISEFRDSGSVEELAEI